MKKIFVATDFSDAAVNAGKYAVELARHFKAKLFLFHAFVPPVEIPESYLFFTTEQVGEKALEQLDREEKTINKYKIVTIEKIAAEGNPTDALLAEAAKQQAYLIICGMKNTGRIAKKIFGSTATSLVH